MRISKGKMKFAKGFEQKWTLELFTNSKILRGSPHNVYESVDMRGELVDGQSYAVEITPVHITKRTEYLVDKILDSRVRQSIRKQRTMWRGYDPAFNSWTPTKDIRRLGP